MFTGRWKELKLNYTYFEAPKVVSDLVCTFSSWSETLLQFSAEICRWSWGRQFEA
jgi:hypothetical protein